MNTIDTAPPQEELFRAGASFRVSGPDLDLEGITQGLGYQPSYIHRRGEPDRIHDRPRPRDMWRLDSPLNKNQDLELHLNWLRERLLPRKDYISSLREKADIDIYCYKTCYTEQASLTLSPHALRIFTELSLELSASLIFLPDDPEQTTESTMVKTTQP
jgi:Domain of unknown function (DUF4279)